LKGGENRNTKLEVRTEQRWLDSMSRVFPEPGRDEGIGRKGRGVQEAWSKLTLREHACLFKPNTVSGQLKG